jgi:hypothetical protein
MGPRKQSYMEKYRPHGLPGWLWQRVKITGRSAPPACGQAADRGNGVLAVVVDEAVLDVDDDQGRVVDGHAATGVHSGCFPHSSADCGDGP